MKTLAEQFDDQSKQLVWLDAWDYCQTLFLNGENVSCTISHSIWLTACQLPTRPKATTVMITEPSTSSAVWIASV